MDTSIPKKKSLTKRYRVLTPPLTPPLNEDNIYVIERIDYIESLLEEKDSIIESHYQEIIKLKDRIEAIEKQLKVCTLKGINPRDDSQV